MRLMDCEAFPKIESAGRFFQGCEREHSDQRNWIQHFACELNYGHGHHFYHSLSFSTHMKAHDIFVLIKVLVWASPSFDKSSTRYD
jgi:hypothetical protein